MVTGRDGIDTRRLPASRPMCGREASGPPGTGMLESGDREVLRLCGVSRAELQVMGASHLLFTMDACSVLVQPEPQLELLGLYPHLITLTKVGSPTE